MELFSVSIMGGAMLLLSLKIILGFVFMYLVYRFFEKYNSGEYRTLSDAIVEIFVAVFIVAFFLTGASIQPKTTISIDRNENLIEYLENNEQIEIQSPESRIEFLPGFIPLETRN